MVFAIADRSSIFATSTSSPPLNWRLVLAAPGARATDAFSDLFDHGLLVRVTGDMLAPSPPLILDTNHIDEIFSRIGEALDRVE